MNRFELKLLYFLESSQEGYRGLHEHTIMFGRYENDFIIDMTPEIRRLEKILS